MKKLKDYLHLYLGCECSTPVGNMFFNGINSYDIKNAVWFHCRWDDKKCRYLPIKNSMVLLKHSIVGKSFKYSEIKPILRPLSSITEEEVAHLFNVDINALITKGNFCPPFFQVEYIDDYGEETFEHRYLNQLDPEQFRFLLSKYFDLFGLIESGLAIAKGKTILTS